MKLARIVPARTRHAPLASRWWLYNNNDRVPYTYLRSADLANDDGADGDVGGRTFIFDRLRYRINQDGEVAHVWTTVRQLGLAPWKFKLFRPNGANYDFVAECAWTPVATGLQAAYLSQPLPCECGDVIGVYLPGDAVAANRGNIGLANGAAAFTYRYADGDIAATDAFATQVASKMIHLAPYGRAPFMAVVGDSIFEGHNTASNWHTQGHNLGPAGNPTAEIWNQLRDLWCPGLQYQNFSLGSQTYNWVNINGFKDAFTTLSLKARVWLLGAGVNDVSTGRAWADTRADLDAIRLRCTTGDLWFTEILPWTTATDAQAETTRLFNANIAAWCDSNRARLVRCHDLMGQLRASTGCIDNLVAGYSQDGVHLSQAGVDALALIIKNALAAVYQ